MPTKKENKKSSKQRKNYKRSRTNCWTSNRQNLWPKWRQKQHNKSWMSYAGKRPLTQLMSQMAKNQSEWRCGVLVRFLADEAEMADWEGYEHSNMEELVSIRVEPSGWCHVHRSRTKYFEYPCAPNEDVVVQLEMSVTDPACPASGFRPGRSGAGGARAHGACPCSKPRSDIIKFPFSS